MKTQIAKKEISSAVLVLVALPIFAGPTATVVRQKPFNLFQLGTAVEFQVKGSPGNISAVDYYGNAVDVSCSAGKISLGALRPGYYEIRHAGGTNSFAVAPFSQMTAAEFLKEKRRFGLKTFLVGRTGIWWRRPLTWEVDECTTACERLGLQWTRHGFDIESDPEAPGIISTLDLVNKHQMNCVMKVEGIPESAYDEKRYGPMADFQRTKNKRGWQRCSVPLKEPYQKWLAEKVAVLPPDQKVFEMGNEVWDYMTATEFAEWCRLSVPVLKKVRPGCSIGADPGTVAWGTEFAKAGGFDGMDAMYIHPYSFTPAPEVRIRAWLRNRREYFEKLAGHSLDYYVTEYGWSTAPKDRRKQAVDERRQAQRTTRESLMLYAEGCKTLIPHWMADREQDPTEREHWFGFFRLCGEPKPVVVAHAACARMIDGSEFAGDLVLPGAETGVGSMLFRRRGEWVAAIWTRDEEPGAGREVVVPVKDVKVYGIMGEERPVRTAKGGVAVKASADVTYIVGKGVPPQSLTRLLDSSGELSETRWLDRVDGTNPGLTVARETPVAKALKCEGRRSSVDCNAEVWHTADSMKIRIAAPAACIKDGSGVVVANFSTRPDRQLSMNEYDFFDYEIRASLQGGECKVTVANSMFKGAIRPEASGDPSGSTWKADCKDGGFTFEIDLPKKFICGFGENKRGLMAGQLCWVSGDKKWLSASHLAQKRYSWPLWRLEK